MILVGTLRAPVLPGMGFFIMHIAPTMPSPHPLPTPISNVQRIILQDRVLDGHGGMLPDAAAVALER